jgi:hypothetical protein
MDCERIHRVTHFTARGSVLSYRTHTPAGTKKPPPAEAGGAIAMQVAAARRLLECSLGPLRVRPRLELGDLDGRDLGRPG